MKMGGAGVPKGRQPPAVVRIAAPSLLQTQANARIFAVDILKLGISELPGLLVLR